MKKILLEKLLDNCKEQEYQKQYEYIINLLEEKKIKPVKASRLNGKSPSSLSGILVVRGDKRL